MRLCPASVWYVVFVMVKKENIGFTMVVSRKIAIPDRLQNVTVVFRFPVAMKCRRCGPATMEKGFGITPNACRTAIARNISDDEGHGKSNVGSGILHYSCLLQTRPIIIESLVIQLKYKKTVELLFYCIIACIDGARVGADLVDGANDLFRLSNP